MARAVDRAQPVQCLAIAENEEVLEPAAEPALGNGCRHVGIVGEVGVAVVVENVCTPFEAIETRKQVTGIDFGRALFDEVVITARPFSEHLEASNAVVDREIARLVPQRVRRGPRGFALGDEMLERAASFESMAGGIPAIVEERIWVMSRFLAVHKIVPKRVNLRSFVPLVAATVEVRIKIGVWPQPLRLPGVEVMLNWVPSVLC